MQHHGSLAQQSLIAIIESIASDDIAPGAGSAGAVGLALAAACAGKAVSVTLKHRPNDELLTSARKTLADIAHRALQGADEDAARFEKFMHDRAASTAQQLLESSTRLAHLGAELLQTIEPLEAHINAAVRADIAAARALCSAFNMIQSTNLGQTRQAAQQGAGT